MLRDASTLPSVTDLATGRRVDIPLQAQIPATVLPEIKSVCPLCALEIKVSRDKCPRCGIPLKGETAPSKPIPESPTVPPVAPVQVPSPVALPQERSVAPLPPEKIEPPLAPSEPVKLVEPTPEIVGEGETKAASIELPAPPPPVEAPPGPSVVSEEPVKPSIEVTEEKEVKVPPAELPPQAPVAVEPTPVPLVTEPPPAEAETLQVVPEPEKPVEPVQEVSGEEEQLPAPDEPPEPTPPVTETPPPTFVPEESAIEPEAPEEIEVVEEVAATEEPVEPSPGIIMAPPAEERISSKGLINGRGATNGTGLVNGRGMVNGTGLVNGTGMINGTRPGYRSMARGTGRMAFLKRWQFLAILMAIVVILPAFIYLSYGRQTAFNADGDFGEWSHVTKFGMQAPAAIPEVSVEEWAVKSDSNALYMYLMTESEVVGTSNVDSFYLFIDSDGSRNSGYSVSSIGAEYLLELHGWDKKIESASLMQFDSSTDQFNWTSWSNIDSLAVATKGQRLEATANLPVTLTSSSRFLLLAQDNMLNQASSVSYPVPEKGGVLIIVQEAGSGIDPMTGLIQASSTVSLARLTLRCEGASGTIDSISPAIVGANPASDITDISLSPGETKTVDVVVDASAALPQSFVSSTIIPASVVRSFADLVVMGEPVAAYVSSTPTSIQIDGAFGDWTGHVTSDTDSGLVANPNIDIAAVGSVNSTEYAAFFASVEGEVFQGSYVPATRGKPTSQGGGGGPVIPHRKTGEDVFRVYIDSDILNTTGQLVQKDSKVIGADYLLEIDGIDGAIVSRTLMVYNSGEWVQALGTVYAASYSQKVEASVTSASIGGATSFAAIIETTDWRSRSDWGWTGTVPDPWAIDANGTTYMSNDGSTWSYLGTPTLPSGDRIVDMAMNTDQTNVFLVTNTGLTYYWTLGTSTNWTAGQTIPIDNATYGDAVAIAFYNKQHGDSAWLFTKTGNYFWLADATKSLKSWSDSGTVPLVGYADYKGLEYAGGTMYAMRSAPDSALNYSGNGNTFSSNTTPTGSTSNQTNFVFLPMTSGESDDVLYVLCENGNIRYSSNGGSTWSPLGDLPTPTGGNTSRYISLGFDPAGYLWVVTDTGYTFRSTDTTTYNNFICTGQTPISSIVAIYPTNIVIPEFPLLAIPVLAMVFLVMLPRIRKRRQRDS